MKNSDKQLSRNQIKAIELLAFESMTQREVATKLGVHENTVTNWKKNAEFIRELTKANKKSITAASNRALATMLGLLKAKSSLVRFYAAKDILDRAGYVATAKIDIEKSTDKLDAILQQLKE